MKMTTLGMLVTIVQSTFCALYAKKLERILIEQMIRYSQTMSYIISVQLCTAANLFTSEEIVTSLTE